ncbi:E3 ubiquitin protein ligase [Shewanella sp. 202IG2-18]|uniref:RING finger domain-containing protein n=1 Tax=Parashewanella hymeniacidonis TaxID=2807618 RepID=UPI00195F4FF2|nr:RING finger protein [Parashewanella hymeniacidonis]MBM7071794.1 E3 ubiquitin protein ligase [Parashewanella hymeniacidonis]
MTVLYKYTPATLYECGKFTEFSHEQIENDSALSEAIKESCPICLVELNKETYAIAANCCKKSFHTSCLLTWLNRHQYIANCPQCRVQMIELKDSFKTSLTDVYNASVPENFKVLATVRKNVTAEEVQINQLQQLDVNESVIDLDHELAHQLEWHELLEHQNRAPFRGEPVAQQELQAENDGEQPNLAPDAAIANPVVREVLPAINQPLQVGDPEQRQIPGQRARFTLQNVKVFFVKTGHCFSCATKLFFNSLTTLNRTAPIMPVNRTLV